MGSNVYLNGEILPIEKAQISVADRGFLYGDGLSEAIRFYKRAPFMLKSHLNRLQQSAADLGISLASNEELKQATFKVIAANDIDEGSLRLTVTRGNSIAKSLYEEIEKPNILISISPLDLEQIARCHSGVKAISGEDVRSAISNHKNTSMLASVISYKQVLEKNAFDMIQITRRGFVTEGLRTNVFVVLDGILLTPPVSKRVLVGVTRQTVINIAQRNGIKVEEDAIVGQDLQGAEEIFLTNSLREVVPVTSLNNQPIASGQIGPITSQIQKAYRLLIENWLQQVFAKVT